MVSFRTGGLSTSSSESFMTASGDATDYETDYFTDEGSEEECFYPAEEYDGWV